MFNLKEKLAGEQQLARHVLAVLPLIEKHFAPFDGKRAHIQTGRSAAFQKVVGAFREEAEALTGAQVFIHDQYQAISVHIKFSRPDPDNRNGGCIYYNADVYFGEWDSGSWDKSPTGDYSHTRPVEEDVGRATQCQQALSTTVEDLEKALVRHKSLQQQLADNKQALAPCFRKVLGE